MRYRPEYHLDRLRMMMSAAAEGEQPLLHLRWLRTMVVDLSRTPEERPQEALDRLELQQRSAVGCAVEHVVCKQLNANHLSHLLPFLTQSVPLLTSLDLRGCQWTVCFEKDFLLRIAANDAHRLSLRRLYLPPCCGVSQSTLDRFTQLEELDVSGCENLTNVDFCSTTLCVLYANNCHNLTDAGLRNATRLEVLHVGGCENVTDVSPFAHCLLELVASWGCGIRSAALSDCSHLQVLNAYFNAYIVSLQPFAQQLRELNAGLNGSLNDAALIDVTGLVKLGAAGNQAITTVSSFGASLRELDADGNTGIRDQDGLVTATNLVCLSARCNTVLRSLSPFASTTLLELEASKVVDDASMSEATNLIWLDVSSNGRVTTLKSCGQSLRHLAAARVADCALTNEGLRTARSW